MFFINVIEFSLKKKRKIQMYIFVMSIWIILIFNLQSAYSNRVLFEQACWLGLWRRVQPLERWFTVDL